MKGVDISKACGYDGVGNKIIKLCSEGFHVYFTHFINLSLSLGQYPSKWKLTNVIPSCFSAGKFFPRSVKKLCSFICITF